MSGLKTNCGVSNKGRSEQCSEELGHEKSGRSGGFHIRHCEHSFERTHTYGDDTRVLPVVPPMKAMIESDFLLF
jgi:hypothetical protein